MGIIAWIVVGLIAGWLAHIILGGRGGLFGNLAVGLIGAIVAGDSRPLATLRAGSGSRK